MFIVQINDQDTSSHTQECDAIAQKQRLIEAGITEDSISLMEKNTFSPIPKD